MKLVSTSYFQHSSKSCFSCLDILSKNKAPKSHKCRTEPYLFASLSIVVSANLNRDVVYCPLQRYNFNLFVVVIGCGGGRKLITEHFVASDVTELLLSQSVRVIESGFKLGVVNSQESEFWVIKVYSFNK